MRLLIFSLIALFTGGLFSSFARATEDISGKSAVDRSEGTEGTLGSLPDGLYAEITTTRGPITAQLFYDKAPLTVTSFVGLAEGTLGPQPRRPFFDGLAFHRLCQDS
jgi:hypothetical protein